MGVYTYMLRCADGPYYVGSATGDDLATRVNQHNVGSHKGIPSRDGPSFLFGLSISSV
jgi:putative endonuclease